MVREVLTRLRFLFSRRRAAEIDEELQAHLEHLTEVNIAAGMTDQEARRQARIAFGGVEGAREACYEQRPGAWLETVMQDIRYALRGFRRNPGFVITVMVTLALGIGANATIFSVVSRFVLQPPPVGDPASLVTVMTTSDHGRLVGNFSWPLYTDVRDQAKSFSGLAGYFDVLPASIGGAGEAQRIWGQAATANYFDVAQIRMTLGRGFLPTEEHADVVVLGYVLWERQFGADPAIVGKTVRLSSREFTVVGVAPPGFHGIDLILNPEFWVPLGDMGELATNLPQVPNGDQRDFHWVTVIGRMKPGVTHAQMDAELNTLAKRYAAVYPATDTGEGFMTQRAGELPPKLQKVVELFLAVLGVVVLLVLGIACANVANLLLARGASRQREMAVRTALGATRARLLRQVLVESVLLALGSGVISVALAWWATRALSVFHLPVPVPLDVSVAVDWRVLAYVFALSVGAGIVFGFLPAWIASRPVLTRALKGEDALGRPGRRIKLRSVLVVSQIAMSLVLLCATGLFLRSLEHASRINTGFRSSGVVMMSVDPRLDGYTPQRTLQFLEQVRERVAALPGVRSAAVTDVVPLSGGHRSDAFTAEGQPKPSGEEPSVDLYMTTPGYFETMGIPLMAGREFGNEPGNGPDVAIVNEAFARHYFGGASPIGRTVNGGGATYQIVGVTKNLKSRTIGEETRLVLFRPLSQTVARDPSMLGYAVLAHPDGDAGEVADAVRRTIHQLDPTMAIFDAETMQEHLRDALFLPRLAGTLFGVIGLLGLILACVGLYGVMSYSVSRRTQEIGIRLAMGAQRSAVLRLILWQGMVLAGIAILLGLPAALAAAKFSESFLYGIYPHDAVTFTFVPVVLAGVALLACWIPARRATQVDPQSTLRHE
ncbi:MAG: ABC transporter permease [Silvibacterium sp.]